MDMSRYPYISARSKFLDVISETVLSVVLIGLAYVDAESLRKLRKARPQSACHCISHWIPVRMSAVCVLVTDPLMVTHRRAPGNSLHSNKHTHTHTHTR
jgi:hypothetical protein